MSNAARWTPLIAPEDTSEEEQDLLWHTCRLDPEGLRRLIIQDRAIAALDISDIKAEQEGAKAKAQAEHDAAQDRVKAEMGQGGR